MGRQLSNVLNASSKKNAMFLLAVVFMVSLNFGPIGYVTNNVFLLGFSINYIDFEFD